MTIICNYVLTRKNYSASSMNTYDLSISYYHSPNKTLEAIENVFLDEATAKNFCKLINENDVDEVHFMDVLEDYLATA